MIPNITEAEERVMNALWGHGQSSLGEITVRLMDAHWSSKTIKTLLDRLCEKGAVGAELVGRRNRYFALIEKEAFARRQINSLKQRLFGGSAQEMLAFFCKSQEISHEQARELISLLEEREQEP